VVVAKWTVVLATSAARVPVAAEPAVLVADDGTSAGSAGTDAVAGWTPEGERELRKIPFFVRTKARRNTERFAVERGLAQITVETLYEAKAHFGR